MSSARGSAAAGWHGRIDADMHTPCVSVGSRQAALAGEGASTLPKVSARAVADPR